MRSPLRLAGYALAALLFAAICYRAATQSVVHDEAFNWQIYLNGPVSNLFTVYDPNHHFLATVLARISTGVLGVSAFTMRLPAVLAGAWYLWTVFELCWFLFAGRPLFLISALALAVNPFVLDFLVAARGYGLALACLFWALYQMALYGKERKLGRLSSAGVSLSLAVAANLTFLIPALVLAGAFAWVLLSQAPAQPVSPPKAAGRKARGKLDRRATPAAELARFLIPAAAVMLAFLLLAPLEAAGMSQFYAGAHSMSESLQSILSVSFDHNGGAGAPVLAWMACLRVLLPLLVLAALVLSWRSAPVCDAVTTVQFLASAAVLGSWLLLAAAHFTIGLLLPLDRTGIYFLPLALLSIACLAETARCRAPWTGHALAVFLAVVAAHFCFEWNTSSFVVWHYDADSPRIIDELESMHTGHSSPPRLGISWQLEPSFNFYRTVRRLDWMPPVGRRGPDGDYDYYVLIPQDQPLLQTRKLRVVFRGEVSGTVLAVPSSQQ